MWCNRFAAAALIFTGFGSIVACSSSEEGDTSIISEARANPPAVVKDYGWHASPNFPTDGKDHQVREYH
jgi:hypothetical protein